MAEFKRLLIPPYTAPEIDANIIPENIKKDVRILDVVGTLDCSGSSIDTSDATATANDILVGKTAYINGVKVEGAIQVYEGETFEFSIDGTSFYSEIGMTWEQWANSDYNTAGYYAGSNEVYLSSGMITYYVQYNSVDVSASDSILKGAAYTHRVVQSSGGSGN